MLRAERGARKDVEGEDNSGLCGNQNTLDCDEIKHLNSSKMYDILIIFFLYLFL